VCPLAVKYTLFLAGLRLIPSKALAYRGFEGFLQGCDALHTNILPFFVQNGIPSQPHEGAILQGGKGAPRARSRLWPNAASFQGEAACG